MNYKAGINSYDLLKKIDSSLVFHAKYLTWHEIIIKRMLLLTLLLLLFQVPVKCLYIT